MNILQTVLMLYASSFAFFLYQIWIAPAGYETRDGFHIGFAPGRAVRKKTMFLSRPRPFRESDVINGKVPLHHTPLPRFLRRNHIWLIQRPSPRPMRFV